MLPKEYRQRYILFFALSFLLHLAVVLFLMWHPIFDTPQKEKGKTVEIKLNQPNKTEPEKKPEEKKKAEQKKSSEKKAEEKKKQEKKKQEKKKQEPKKIEQKKEYKKEEQKKPEPKKKEKEKKQESKKEQKQETKKDKDPLSENFSVDKPKDSQSKENKPKESQASKQSKAQQGKKSPDQEKPKGQQTQADAAKSATQKTATKPEQAKAAKQTRQPKQGEPSKGQVKPGEASKAAPTKGPQSPKSPELNQKKALAKEMDPNSLEYWTKRWGSKQVLDERTMKRTVVMAKGLDDQFQKRKVEGDKVVQTLNRYQKQMFNKYLLMGANKIVESYVAPKKDGRQYQGAISILLDRNGYIVKMAFKRLSGHDELDRAMYQAVANTTQLELPPDPQAAYAMYLKPLEFSYDETDMAD